MGNDRSFLPITKFSIEQSDGVTAISHYLKQRTIEEQGLFLKASSSLVGPIQDQAYYRETLPSHNIMDLRAGVFADKWGAYFVATNLTNKLAALTIDNTVFAWQQPTITRVSTNQPRTLGVDFTYKF